MSASDQGVWLLGEALVDLIQESDGRYSACLGGSVFNVGLALSRLGQPVTYLNPFSTDRWGQSFTDRAMAEGLAPSPLGRSACLTSLAVVSTDALGQPTYAFYRDRVADRDWTAEALLAEVSGAPGRVLHTGGLALMPSDWPKLRVVLEAWRMAGGLVSMDLNVRPTAAEDAQSYRAVLQEAVRAADLLKVSQEDLEALGQLDHSAGADQALEAYLRWMDLHEAHPALAVLTRGEGPGWWVTKTAAPQAFSPRSVSTVIDTVGAGDCFWAALLAGLSRLSLLGAEVLLPQSVGLAMEWACLAAAHNIAHRGCEPIRASELFSEES